MSLTNEDSRKRKKRAEHREQKDTVRGDSRRERERERARERERERESEREREGLLSNTQQCEHHEFDNSGPDLARRGQVPNELGVGKVSSAFKLCGHF